MNSTPSDAKKSLTVAEIRELIEICSKNGIAELHFGELKIVSGPIRSSASTSPVFIPEQVTRAAQAIEQTVHTQEKINSAEEDHSQLMIEDPYLYEETILRMQREQGQTEI